MRRLIPLALATLALAACATEKSSDAGSAPVTGMVAVAPFSAIHNRTDAAITYRRSDTTRVEVVYAADTCLRVRVKDSTLVVSGSKTPRDKRHSRRNASYRLVVSAPTLAAITNSGILTLSGDTVTHARRISLKDNGISRIDACLVAPGIEVNSSGIGTLHLYARGQNVALRSSGIGTVTLDVDCRQLNVRSTGIGTVKLRGKADQVTEHKNGIGTVSSHITKH